MVIDFVPIVALALVVYTFTNLTKYLLNRQWNAALTLVIGWLGGVGAVWLFGATAWGPEISVGAKSLDLLSFPDKMVVGLVIVSTAAFGYDLKRAFDRSDSAQTPPLTALLAAAKDAPAGFNPNPNVTTTPPAVVTEPVVFHDVPPTAEG